MVRSLIVALSLLASAGPAAAATDATDAMARQIPRSVYEHRSGVVQTLDFGSYRARVEGVDYEVARDVVVFDDGLESAFTLLSVGDALEFTYEREMDGMRRRLIRVIEVVDPERLEQH
jgi:hypothetical protein